MFNTNKKDIMTRRVMWWNDAYDDDAKEEVKANLIKKIKEDQ